MVDLVKRSISCGLALTMVFSGVYAQPLNSRPVEANESNFSLSELSVKQKVGGGIGIGGTTVGIAGIVIYALIKKHSKSHEPTIPTIAQREMKTPNCEVDTVPANCENRYKLLVPGEKITLKSYNSLYVKGNIMYGSVFPEWYGKQPTDNVTALALDREFINKVMERRFAHLQQCNVFIILNCMRLRYANI